MLRSRRIPTARIVLAAAVLVLAPASLAAQTVTGRVVDARTGQPVPGATVMLLTAGGERHAAVLADVEGRYAATARVPGDYQLRVERVGYASAAPVPVRLQVGERLQMDLRADARRITLEPVVATGAARACATTLPGGPQTAAVWDEARKALQSAALVESTGSYTFRVRMSRRELNLRGHVLSERAWPTEVVGTPFLTVPADELVRGGYVVFDADSLILYGLGAPAILSDAFLEQHCFGVRDGGREHPGWVGLEFVPLSSRARPDVRGVLWLDRASSELRRVDYAYTGLGMSGPADALGGRLEFRRMESGEWVISRWYVRGPLLRYDQRLVPGRQDLAGYRLRGLLETAGEVAAVRPTGS